jgi:hypothetical protein
MVKYLHRLLSIKFNHPPRPSPSFPMIPIS